MYGANFSYILLTCRCERSRIVMCMSVGLTFQSAVCSFVYRNVLRRLANDICALWKLPVSGLCQVSHQRPLAGVSHDLLTRTGEYHYQVQYVLYEVLLI